MSLLLCWVCFGRFVVLIPVNFMAWQCNNLRTSLRLFFLGGTVALFGSGGSGMPAYEHRLFFPVVFAVKKNGIKNADHHTCFVYQVFMYF